MYNDFLINLKNDITALKNKDNESIFNKVTIGATKSDDDLSLASIFLSNANHKQLTTFRYESEMVINIVCIFQMRRNDNIDIFLQDKYNEIEILENYVKQKYNLTSTEFSQDIKGLYCMLTFNNSKVVT